MDTSNHKNELIHSLQMLLQKNHDAAEGLKHLTGKTDSTVLGNWLQKKAEEREGFVIELEKELKKLGSEYKASSNILESAHRAWINVKTTFSTNIAETILEECIKGDEMSVVEYTEQLNAPYMTKDVAEVLSNQKAKVEHSLYMFKRMEDIVK